MARKSPVVQVACWIVFILLTVDLFVVKFFINRKPPLASEDWIAVGIILAIMNVLAFLGLMRKCFPKSS